MICKYETEWCKKHVHCETCEHHYESEIITATSEMMVGCMPLITPKLIARVKLCGGALTFNFHDTDPVQFEMPTKEQCENLKKTFGIEVELVEGE